MVKIKTAFTQVAVLAIYLASQLLCIYDSHSCKTTWLVGAITVQPVLSIGP